MSRYLTPSKIGILALIELYTEYVSPHSSTIAIVPFILNQLLPRPPKHQNLELNLSIQSYSRSLPLATDLKSFELLLTSHPASVKFSNSSLWDSFLIKLWDIDSLDALHIFFARRNNLLSKTREELKRASQTGTHLPSDDIVLLSRTSPFGSFIRRSLIEFERLKFNDSVELWIAFVEWRRDSQTYWEQKIAVDRRWTGDKESDKTERDRAAKSIEKLELISYGLIEPQNPADGFLSTDYIEKLLEFQVEKIQRLGNRIPCEILTEFKNILEKSILIPSLSHYLVFLESWKSGDYSTSFDSLHRYFDYTMQNKDRLFYQYALMNLAVLQADFCCFDEAVATMLETVSTARENKDMPCLNFALNWLYHFGKVHPKIISGTGSTNMLGVEREGLSFLRIKAKETGMWSLWSSSLLSEAKLAMVNGESVATVFENIAKSSQLIVEKNMKSMIGPQVAIHSSFWGRLGICQLFKQYCEIFLTCNSQFAVFEDILRFTNRIAYLLAEQGQYDKALDMLERLDSNSLRSWKANHYWLRCKGLIRLKRDLRRDNLDGAAQILAQLIQINFEDKDTDLSFEINMLHIDYLIRRNDYRQALETIEEILSSMKEDGEDINLKISLLVSKAFLYDKAGRPQKGFSIALRAASIAWRSRLLTTLWAAMGVISNILTSLTEFQASVHILTAIFPRALECGNCALIAQLYSFLGDAYMGLAGQAEHSSLSRKEKLTQSFNCIKSAHSEFSKLADIKGQSEMMAKMATIMKVMGKISLAEKYASSYLKLKNQLRNGMS